MNPSDHFQSVKQTCPRLGVGIGLRRPLFGDTMAHRPSIDWLEIVPENVMGKGGYSRYMIEQALDLGFPIIPHGVNLSIGSTDAWNDAYLTELERLFRWIQPAWFSDHLCFTYSQGVYFNDLLPLPHTWEAVHHVAGRIRALQERFEIPFLIENVSTYARFGPCEMTEAQFLAEILERADCGLMLDVNNIYVNAHNHGYDPIEFLDTLPLERTVQLHVAGHLRQKHLLIDTHGTSVCEDVWTLLEEVLKRTDVHGILIERDAYLPPIEALLEEVQRARTIWAKTRTEATVQ